MNSLGQQMKRHFHLADTLDRLILLNVGVFLIIRLVNAISTLFLTPVFEFEFITYYLAVPANVTELLHRPWTLVTYMFLHWDAMHILFNMLWLYWMGKILVEFLGKKKILSTYILGGLAGAVFYIIAFNVFPLFRNFGGDASFALGASASILAVTVAAATLVPDYSMNLLFFGPVRLKYIAMVAILLDVISVSSANAGGHIAHLGGAFFGFIYIRQLKNGRDLAGWFNKLISKRQKKSKMRVEVVATRNKKRDEDFIIQKKANEERMDEILDKISRSGWGSLSKEERDFMHEISNQKNKN